MPRNCRCKHKHQQLRPPMLIHNAEDAEANGEPHHCDRHYFHTQRDGTVLAEIADILAQIRVVYEPIIQAVGATEKCPRRQKQQRRSGQQREKDSHHTQHQRERA